MQDKYSINHLLKLAYFYEPEMFPYEMIYLVYE